MDRGLWIAIGVLIGLFVIQSVMSIGLILMLNPDGGLVSAYAKALFTKLIEYIRQSLFVVPVAYIVIRLALRSKDRG